MTEAYEDEWVVRVRAQVMCRDEGTGGWVALGGGGLANVMLGRRPRHSHSQSHKRSSGGESSTDESSSRPSHAHTPSYEYFIYGKRISDQTVVLSCTIKKDFQYNKVMPTFHHWVTEEKRFGLTFQTAADARAFDRGVRAAVADLLHGLGGAWPSLDAYKQLKAAPKDDDEENNIFECLNLPSDSRSSSENSTASRPDRQRHRHDITQTPILSAITLPALAHERERSLTQESVGKQKGPGLCSEETDKLAYLDDNPDGDNYPYVHLTASHEYAYPQVGSGGVSEKTSPNTKPPLLKSESGSIKKRGVYSPAPLRLPDKKPNNKPEAFQARIKCRHCHEWYLESANRAGACEFAPDCCRACVDAVSCIKCAQCMVYHCMADAEGEFALHPCACACAPPDHTCASRWLGITLLSLIVPCLWCYPPLHCVHRSARACGLAGGEHAPHHM